MLQDVQNCKNWVNTEVKHCQFHDERLKKRYTKLLGTLANSVGESIPYACQDWANTKAAYRFFDNDKLSEYEILSGHFAATKQRVVKNNGPVLILHDTTEFSYKRNEPELIGATRIIPGGRKAYGQFKRHTICGMLMHASLVITTSGLPLGLSAVKFWTREKFKGTTALKKHVNPTRLPIETKESIRWLENIKQSTELLGCAKNCIHIGDRESDIYELFCTANTLGTHFLVRTCVNRLAGDGHHTIAEEMAKVEIKGLHQIAVQNRKGKFEKATLKIQYKRIKVLPPIGKQKRYPSLVLTVIHAKESKKPKNREPISWKLLTNLSVQSKKQAIEKLKWYAMRWKIETFHKILKSGCKAESTKIRTADRLNKLIAVFCILSWRIFWLTMLNRTLPNSSYQLALTKSEKDLLDCLVRQKHQGEHKNKTIADYLTLIARLGGYLARTSDSPPGNTVIWQGMSRLTDISLGFNLALEFVGN